jgi:hypothetical protein
VPDARRIWPSRKPPAPLYLPTSKHDLLGISNGPTWSTSPGQRHTAAHDEAIRPSRQPRGPQGQGDVERDLRSHSAHPRESRLVFGGWRWMHNVPVKDLKIERLANGWRRGRADRLGCNGPRGLAVVSALQSDVWGSWVAA